MPMRRSGFLLLFAGLCLTLPAPASAQSKFQVSIDPGQVKSPPETGRVLLILQRAGGAPATPGRRPRGNEPLFQLGLTGLTASPYFGVDLDPFTAERTAVIDDAATPFPVAKLSE